MYQRRPILCTDAFELLLPAVLEAHATSEIWCAVRVCALVALVREVVEVETQRRWERVADSHGDAGDADSELPARCESLAAEVADSKDAVVEGSVADRACRACESETVACAPLHSRRVSSLVPDSGCDIDEAKLLSQLRLTIVASAGGRLDEPTALPRRVKSALTTYLARARALCALMGVPLPPANPARHTDGGEWRASRWRGSAVLDDIGAPSIEEILRTPALMRLVMGWAATLAAWTHGGSSSMLWPSRRLLFRPRPLHPLPMRFTDLYKQLAGHVCAVTKAFPEEPAICLLCGALLCAGTGCCKQDGVGALTRHVASCAAGAGIFFLVHRCSTVLLRGPHAAYSISPYLDEHGEEDAGLRRGRPLHLDAERFAQLSKMWSGHVIAGEVVRSRTSLDRVIREAFY